MYTDNAPTPGENAEHTVRILWQDGRVTESRVKWYGVGTRSEFRLTRFGHGFPFLVADTVGDLLVLITKSHAEFIAYVLDLDEDIEEVQAALGVEPFERWGVYQGGAPRIEEEDECIQRNFRAFAEPLDNFPTGDRFSAEARRILLECVEHFRQLTPDTALMKCMETEYELFRFVERQICQPEVARVFKNVDDFLQTAARIMNRRKARAGRALENHVHYLLSEASIPHEMRPQQIDGKPDVVIPSTAAYQDPSYPSEKLLVLGIKTTCKDRWRQVLNEGKKVPDKHIITMQPGISSNQLQEMYDSRVTLVVPENLHGSYPSEHEITLLSVAGFIECVRARIA